MSQRNVLHAIGDALGILAGNTLIGDDAANMVGFIEEIYKAGRKLADRETDPQPSVLPVPARELDAPGNRPPDHPTE